MSLNISEESKVEQKPALQSLKFSNNYVAAGKRGNNLADTSLQSELVYMYTSNQEVNNSKHVKNPSGGKKYTNEIAQVNASPENSPSPQKKDTSIQFIEEKAILKNHLEKESGEIQDNKKQNTRKVKGSYTDKKTKQKRVGSKMQKKTEERKKKYTEIQKQMVKVSEKPKKQKKDALTQILNQKKSKNPLNLHDIKEIELHKNVPPPSNPLKEVEEEKEPSPQSQNLLQPPSPKIIALTKTNLEATLDSLPENSGYMEHEEITFDGNQPLSLSDSDSRPKTTHKHKHKTQHPHTDTNTNTNTQIPTQQDAFTFFSHKPQEQSHIPQPNPFMSHNLNPHSHEEMLQFHSARNHHNSPKIRKKRKARSGTPKKRRKNPLVFHKKLKKKFATPNRPITSEGKNGAKIHRNRILKHASNKNIGKTGNKSPHPPLSRSDIKNISNANHDVSHVSILYIFDFLCLEVWFFYFFDFLIFLGK